MMQMDKEKNKIIQRLELELLSTLFDYVVPFIDKKICIKAPKEEQQKPSNLEDIVNNPKPKIDFKDIKELESLLFNKKFSFSTKIFSEVKHLQKVSNASHLKLFDYISDEITLTLRRKKIHEKSNDYSISIKYEENQQEEKLSASIKKDDKELYSAEIINEKSSMALQPNFFPNYGIKISYEDNYAEERLSITYKQQLRNYLRRHIESKEDMTNRVPLKWLNILPETIMGGVLGFTYLGENFMVRRADLTGKTARMVDIHESIHTPDEYETRILTRWIMENARNKYIR